MSDVNYIAEVRPNPGNGRDAQCSICGAVLVCLSCGNHRDERVQVLEDALRRVAERKMPDGSFCWCMKAVVKQSVQP